MSKTTSQFSVQLDSASVKILEGISETIGCTPEKLAADIIRSHLSSYQHPAERSDRSKRLSPRKSVNITAAISVPCEDNVLSYRKVIITDVSLGGLGGEVTVEYEALGKALGAAKTFDILFALPGTQDLLSFECHLSHSRINGTCRFGGAFIAPSGSSLNKLLELLASPCTANDHDSTQCRQRQHLSVYQTDS
ncbi:PilZ domain-containing protein [Oleidesulfovibrio sp.]|uniref:PilZ domain-containing protein n=1 Tax=Oleidesulfovibrio sp. TaxID=2909707 RepID=UPI003A876FB4